MGKEEEGFGVGILEFLLWVSKSQALDLYVLVMVAETVAGDDDGTGVGVGVGVDVDVGESNGFVERLGKDCHYHFVGDDDCGW
jgi:hypothetical protein